MCPFCCFSLVEDLPGLGNMPAHSGSVCAVRLRLLLLQQIRRKEDQRPRGHHRARRHRRSVSGEERVRVRGVCGVRSACVGGRCGGDVWGEVCVRHTCVCVCVCACV